MILSGTHCKAIAAGHLYRNFINYPRVKFSSLVPVWVVDYDCGIIDSRLPRDILPQFGANIEVIHGRRQIQDSTQ